MVILLLIQDRGSMSRTQIYEATGTNPRIPADRIKELLDAKLIRETPRPSDPKVMLLELTKKGIKVAEHLAKIEDCINAEA